MDNSFLHTKRLLLVDDGVIVPFVLRENASREGRVQPPATSGRLLSFTHDMQGIAMDLPGAGQIQRGQAPTRGLHFSRNI